MSPVDRSLRELFPCDLCLARQLVNRGCCLRQLLSLRLCPKQQLRCWTALTQVVNIVVFEGFIERVAGQHVVMFIGPSFRYLLISSSNCSPALDFLLRARFLFFKRRTPSCEGLNDQP